VTISASRLDQVTSHELARRGWGTLLVVPLGSTEQHGPHLPLGTDTMVANELCDRLAQRRDDVLVATPLGIGASGEHQEFIGTISIGTDVLAAVLTEVVRSARSSFRGVVVVSGHGGNAAALARASTTAMREGDDLLCFSPSIEGGDAHAGRSETSMLLALDPSLVRQDEVVIGTLTPLSEIASDLRDGRLKEVSPTGILGDPTAASLGEGRALLDMLSNQLLDVVDSRFPR
jgi:mycofactocin precursor peptide peptidase